MAREQQATADNQAIESGVDVRNGPALCARTQKENLESQCVEQRDSRNCSFCCGRKAVSIRPSQTFTVFEAYDFGPCMDDLYDDVDFSQDIGLIQVSEFSTGNEYEDADEESFLKNFGIRFPKRKTRRDYSLTASGLEAGAELYAALQDDERERLVQIKKRFNSMPFFDLLRYVYQKYPNFAKKSVLSL